MSTEIPAPESSRTGGSGGKGERRRRRKRVRRDSSPAKAASPVRRVLFWVFVVIGLGAAAFMTYVLMIYPRAHGPGGGKEIELTFAEGETPSAVAEKLASNGLLASPGTFTLYARLVGMHVAPGRHLLTDDASPHELVARLERNGSATKAKVVIPEGWNRFDIAKRLHALHVTTAQAFIDASANPDLLRELSVEGDSFEGFLFPATYDVPLDSDPADVLRRLVGEFERRWTQLEQNHRLGRAQLEGTLHWTRRDMITLASMVEKEAAVDEERPIIASVFINRLRDPNFKKKILQCDSTSIYGCHVLKEKAPSCTGFNGKPSHAINMDPLNTYSTYVHEGLPPGPIANPGSKSLQAVLAPSTTKYLYFVTRGDRRHAFSETLEDHNRAVEDLKQRSPKNQ
jgi:UPF0755 protein